MFKLHRALQLDEETSILQRQSQLQRIGISSQHQPESVLQNQSSGMAMPSGDILTAEGHATAGEHADVFHFAKTQLQVLHTASTQCNSGLQCICSIVIMNVFWAALVIADAEHHNTRNPSDVALICLLRSAAGSMATGSEGMIGPDAHKHQDLSHQISASVA